jgi:hypothetical protein
MTDWNNRFTQLIRQSRPNLWGNWALASFVKPGAVGFVDSSTGAFKLVAESLPGVALQENPLPSTWKLSSEGVTRQQASAKGSGSVIDPNTGLTIKPEVELVWTFQDKHAIASEFAIAKEVAVKNLGVLSQQYKWLLAEARKVGFAQGDQIAQGFGVITEVIYAQSGLNLGSNDRNASYALGGTVEGLQAMLGDKGPSAGVKANYSYSRETRSLDKHVWPTAEGEVPTTPVAVAFAFSSFQGRTLLPAWRKRISGLSIHLDSKASKATTYITKAKLSYTVNGVKRQEPVATISGGMSGSFDNIPINAANLSLELTFVGLIKDEKQTLSWAVPLAQWPQGEMHIDITGTWPGRPKATIRHDLNNAF